MKIGSVTLTSPFVVAPMAGMTDTAFRRLVKRQGGCGLVVTEMVSSEGLVRGIDRTLEYAEYTEEERPVSIQIFGGDPAKMADAAQIVEGMGADIVDVNMGCPVPKISKHNAGCSLMRDPGHAARVVGAMTRAVKIPVTVKMRAGWNDGDSQRAAACANGAGCRRCGGDDSRTHRRAVLQRPCRLGARRSRGQRPRHPRAWQRRLRRARADHRASGNGCERCAGRTRRAAQPVDPGAGCGRRLWSRAACGERCTRGANSCSTTFEMLLDERVNEADGFRHVAPGVLSEQADEGRPARGHERWVINKLRALCSWYSKGLDGGSQLRVRVNSAERVSQLRQIVDEYFLTEEASVPEVV